MWQRQVQLMSAAGKSISKWHVSRQWQEGLGQKKEQEEQ